jgi:hypothetical protein
MAINEENLVLEEEMTPRQEFLNDLRHSLSLGIQSYSSLFLGSDIGNPSIMHCLIIDSPEA